MRRDVKLRLADKVVLITGAGCGIGQACAELFAQEGAKVACSDIDLKGAEETVAMIRHNGDEAIAIEADVCKSPDVQAMVDRTIESFGRLDLLFNNAGPATRLKLHEQSEEQWLHDVDANLNAVYRGCKAAIPHFIKQGSGNILSSASTLGLLALEGFPAFAAAKAGVIMLTRQLALEYGPQIRVNCICPGATDTPNIRRAINARPDPVAGEREIASINRVMQRLATPDEIAYAALFLASDESSFITGHALVVDGGQTIDA